MGLVNINCPNVDNRRIQLAYTDASGANQTFDAKDASGVKATWKFDMWYDIDVRINTASQTYRVYFNGTPLRDSDGNAGYIFVRHYEQDKRYAYSKPKGRRHLHR